MKKLLIVAALILTAGITTANAGVSFEVSVGDRHDHGKGYGRAGYGGHSGYHGERHGHYAPRYIVRECERPRYYSHRHTPPWGYRPKPCCDRRHGHRH